jgi:amino-acid N-acetyltransferase
MGKIDRRDSASQDISVEPANKNDLPDILSLLERSNLPQEGLASHVTTILAARKAERIVGSAALEVYGREALLRSVAVEKLERGKGLGQQLTNAALDLARQHKVKTVFLLTETADGFFSRFGFQRTSRSQVPSTIQQSVEFTSACPISALVMMLSL